MSEIILFFVFFPGTPLSFARSLKYWATRSSARFGGVVRHCLDGNGEEFEETVKVLMVNQSRVETKNKNQALHHIRTCTYMIITSVENAYLYHALSVLYSSFVLVYIVVTMDTQCSQL